MRTDKVTVRGHMAKGRGKSSATEESICCNPLGLYGQAAEPSRPCISHGGRLGPETEAVLGQVFLRAENRMGLGHSADSWQPNAERTHREKNE